MGSNEGYQKTQDLWVLVYKLQALTTMTLAYSRKDKLIIYPRLLHQSFTLPFLQDRTFVHIPFVQDVYWEQEPLDVIYPGRQVTVNRYSEPSVAVTMAFLNSPLVEHPAVRTTIRVAFTEHPAWRTKILT